MKATEIISALEQGKIVRHNLGYSMTSLDELCKCNLSSELLCNPEKFEIMSDTKEKIDLALSYLYESRGLKERNVCYDEIVTKSINVLKDIYAKTS